MKESIIQRGVMDYLTMIETSHNLYWFRSAAGAVQTVSGRYFKTGRPGAPDVTVCWSGKFIGIEIKSEIGTMSPAQKRAKAQIEAAGGEYHIVRSIADIKAVFASAVPG